MSLSKREEVRKRTRESKEAQPKCHVCTRHTMRICSVCKKPACKNHSRGLSSAPIKGNWICSACDPDEKYWEPG